MTGLMERYMSSWPALSVVDREILYGGPERQRQLIELGQQQIAAQWQTIEEIRDSAILNAEMIAAEITNQTRELEFAIDQLGSQISWDLSKAAETVAKAIEAVGSRLCVCLDEIRWEIVQQQQTLKGILQVLQSNRRNEAQQLVGQGLRHYRTGEFTEAEERFRRALDWDTTDYQVLMNLAYVELQKGNAVMLPEIRTSG